MSIGCRNGCRFTNGAEKADCRIESIAGRTVFRKRRNCSVPLYFALSTRRQLHKDADYSEKYGGYSQNMQK